MTTDTKIRMAADIGGTFTDIVVSRDGHRYTRKVLTTPKQPEVGMLKGLSLALGDAGADFADVDVFVHGTTLATNAIIERRGARTAVIATEGFRDTLEIATESRFNQYDLMIDKPRQLVPDDLRFTLPERSDVNGRVLVPLDEDAARGLAKTLKAAGVDAVAVCFIHSYANAAHERRVAEILAEEAPGIYVSSSCDVSPEMREYERTSTTVANAYVQPLMDSYLRRMETELEARGFTGQTFMMTSGGGLTSVASACETPVRLVESGPAGGAIFAADVAAVSGQKDVLSFDMGGTTAKICLIEDGEPSMSRVFEVDRSARFMKGSGLPLRIPVIEMVEIGAGGGSVAKVDDLGRITVGPRSVSSEPGPAAYDLGGTEAAVTDADVAIGLIDPNGFANGTMTLKPELSRAALCAHVGAPLGISPDMAAHGVYEMVCENMASAARVHAAEMGFAADQRFMIAFGGAAPVHAARVAEKIGSRGVLIPSNAGVGSAVGFLTAPISYEVIRSYAFTLVEEADFDTLNAVLSDMEDTARSHVVPAVGEAEVETIRLGFMRYRGQGHEIGVLLPAEMLSSGNIPEIRALFEAEYKRQFFRVIPGATVEMTTCSVQVKAARAMPDAQPAPERTAEAQPYATRAVFDGETGAHRDIPVYDRARLNPGAWLSGPAIITEIETSTYVTASFDAHCDAAGCIVMTRKD